MPIKKVVRYGCNAIPQQELVNLYYCKIGKRTKIAAFVEIGKDVVIGEDCKIEAFSFIPPGVEIGNNVFIGPHVCFTNDKHPPSLIDFVPLKTIVEDGVSIGAGAIILPGITLHKNCVIGAGSVVTRDIAKGITVFGNPASRHKNENK